MNTTLVYAESGRLVVSKTLIETAKQVTDMRGTFNVQDILFALESQAVSEESKGHIRTAQEIREITAQTVRSRLIYNNFTYRGGRKPANWIWLTQAGDWFTWNYKSSKEELCQA